MRLAGYYRKFIENFSKIAFLITSLQNKEVKFIWNEKCEVSFKKLKESLKRAPVLKVADIDKYFVVCTDSCKEGLGGVLLQDDHVIAYESWKLKYGEKKQCNPWLEIGCNHTCLKDVETLPYGE